jgi:protoporphyrinogen IX oxidase
VAAVMLAVWLKVLHIATLTLWGGGLLALPGLIAHESRPVAGKGGRVDAVWRHRVSRYAYDVIVSPAAVVAIGSGTALIFVTKPLEGWLFLKLAAVGGLVITHMTVGRCIDQLEGVELRPSGPLPTVLLLAAIFFICLVLWLVLQKPEIPESVFPRFLLEGPDALPIPLPQLGSSGTLTPT